MLFSAGTRLGEKLLTLCWGLRTTIGHHAVKAERALWKSFLLGKLLVDRETKAQGGTGSPHNAPAVPWVRGWQRALG